MDKQKKFKMSLTKLNVTKNIRWYILLKVIIINVFCGIYDKLLVIFELLTALLPGNKSFLATSLDITWGGFWVGDARRSNRLFLLRCVYVTDHSCKQLLATTMPSSNNKFYFIRWFWWLGGLNVIYIRIGFKKQ